MARFSPAIARLIAELGKLPGIGNKSAQRLAFHLLSRSPEQIKALADSILSASLATKLCSRCCNLTELDPCEICQSTTRDRTIVCVVETPRDVAAMERIHEYHGMYHVLHGAISPMHGIGPDQIHLRELLIRLRTEAEINEVILATNPTVEGEATALYIARLI
jgi:recombination protein RecR